MYCAACGKEIPNDARFCVHCGVQVGSAGVPAAVVPPATPFPGLYRSRSQRMIAGLCGGLAETYGWDVAVVRLITALGIFFSCSIFFFAYIVAWIIVPEEPLLVPVPPVPPSAPPPTV